MLRTCFSTWALDDANDSDSHTNPVHDRIVAIIVEVVTPSLTILRDDLVLGDLVQGRDSAKRAGAHSVEWIRAETTGNRSCDGISLTHPGSEPTSQASHHKKTLARVLTPPSIPAQTATLPSCVAGRQLPAVAERSVPQREPATKPTSLAIRFARCHNFRSYRSRHANIGNSSQLASPIACSGASAVRSRRNTEVAMSNENPDSLENRDVIQS